MHTFELGQGEDLVKSSSLPTKVSLSTFPYRRRTEISSKIPAAVDTEYCPLAHALLQRLAVAPWRFTWKRGDEESAFSIYRTFFVLPPFSAKNDGGRIAGGVRLSEKVEGSRQRQSSSSLRSYLFFATNFLLLLLLFLLLLPN